MFRQVAGYDVANSTWSGGGCSGVVWVTAWLWFFGAGFEVDVRGCEKGRIDGVSRRDYTGVRRFRFRM
jgi:hypothetical protein